MFTESTAKQDPASSVVPEVRLRMPWRVGEAIAIDGFQLRVRFLDGLEGTVEMGEWLRSSRSGVFAPLADPALFAQVFVEHGAVSWPGELDLAPDAMYRAIKERGSWVLR